MQATAQPAGDLDRVEHRESECPLACTTRCPLVHESARASSGIAASGTASHTSSQSATSRSGSTLRADAKRAATPPGALSRRALATAETR